MGLIFTILLWGLAALLAALIAAILLPVRLDIFLWTAPERRFGVIARPLLGLAPGIPLVGGSRAERTPAKPDKPRKRLPFRARRGAMLRAAPELLAGLLRSVRLEALRIDVAFGAADPAATGHLYGVLSPLVHVPLPVPVSSVSLRPVFDRAMFEGRIDASVRVLPARILGAAMRFGWRVLGPGT